MNLPAPPPESKDWTREQWDDFLMLVFPIGPDPERSAKVKNRTKPAPRPLDKIGFRLKGFTAKAVQKLQAKRKAKTGENVALE